MTLTVIEPGSRRHTERDFETDRELTAVAGDQADHERVPGIADQQIDKRAPGLSVSTANTANNANALGGQPASAFATRSELAQTVVGPGRVVSGSVTLAASAATGDVPVLTVDGVIDLVLNCDPGQMFWEFINRSDEAMHFSGIALREGMTGRELPGERASRGHRRIGVERTRRRRACVRVRRWRS